MGCQDVSDHYYGQDILDIGTLHQHSPAQALFAGLRTRNGLPHPTHHISFVIIKEDISLCYGSGMDMVHPDFPFQSIREKEFKREIKGTASS